MAPGPRKPQKGDKNMNITEKVITLKELEQFADEIAAEIEGIKDEIKREMESQGTDEMTVGVFKIRWKEVTSKRFDSKRFKAEHEDMYTAYQKESKSKRFTIQ